MPSKKKKYNARFPAGRIKKIMQTDEEVGKVAQAVPVIISRTLELFVESLLKKTVEITNAKNAKTLTPSHMKQCILSEHRFDFLADLVKNIPDAVNEEEPLPNEGTHFTSSVSRRRTSVETGQSNVKPNPASCTRSNSCSSSSSHPRLSHVPPQPTFVSSTTPPGVSFVPHLSQNFTVSQPSHNTGVSPIRHNIPASQPSHGPSITQVNHGASNFSQNSVNHNAAVSQLSHNSIVSQQSHNSAVPQFTVSIPSVQNNQYTPHVPYLHISYPPQSQEASNTGTGFQLNLCPPASSENTASFTNMIPSYAPVSAPNLVIDEDYDN